MSSEPDPDRPVPRRRSRADPLVDAHGLLPPDEQKDGSPSGEVYTSSDGSSLGMDDHTALELREYGEESATSREMNLPSFKPVYTWLNLVPLEVTHECVKIRLQQQPKEPSALSIRQLITECKEALKAAVVVRQRFIRRMRAIRPTPSSELCMTKLDLTLESFDADVKQMLEVYLYYIKRLLLMMQGEIEVSAAQKNLLEEEWAFAKCICPHIASGEAIAGRNFCFLVSDILPTIGDLLENGIDTCIASLQRSFSVPGGTEAQRSRLSTLSTLREFRGLFQEAQDRALKVLLFAKLLRRDLEIAAEFSIRSTSAGILARLAATGHVRVIAPHSQNHVIFIPGSIRMDRAYVWQLLDMTLSRQDSRKPAEVGYLVLMACHDCGDVDSVLDRHHHPPGAHRRDHHHAQLRGGEWRRVRGGRPTLWWRPWVLSVAPLGAVATTVEHASLSLRRRLVQGDVDQGGSSYCAVINAGVSASSLVR
ncbi:mitogen-activated protein kinase kinase kinase 4-like [Pollicipes pollicipes]|uniref:mitogen-activated protein kinase kinase kinase 4-like n=1 Tax=Pollicipes pollicipes TaxID=41117 RepID=UPI0018854596|nr:mitogen-activated protein kinase kinase kinase 4-like [Pollicipes pollicipes]